MKRALQLSRSHVQGLISVVAKTYLRGALLASATAGKEGKS